MKRHRSRLRFLGDKVMNENVALGKVEWFAPWKRSIFVPFADTFYEAECLADIMHERRRDAARRRMEVDPDDARS